MWFCLPACHVRLIRDEVGTWAIQTLLLWWAQMLDHSTHGCCTEIFFDQLQYAVCNLLSEISFSAVFVEGKEHRTHVLCALQSGLFLYVMILQSDGQFKRCIKRIHPFKKNEVKRSYLRKGITKILTPQSALQNPLSLDFNCTEGETSLDSTNVSCPQRKPFSCTNKCSIFTVFTWGSSSKNAFHLFTRRVFISLMPCSDATAITWSKALSRPRSLTTSFMCSLTFLFSTSDPDTQPR